MLRLRHEELPALFLTAPPRMMLPTPKRTIDEGSGIGSPVSACHAMASKPNAVGPITLTVPGIPERNTGCGVKAVAENPVGKEFHSGRPNLSSETREGVDSDENVRI